MVGRTVSQYEVVPDNTLKMPYNVNGTNDVNDNIMLSGCKDNIFKILSRKIEIYALYLVLFMSLFTVYCSTQ